MSELALLKEGLKYAPSLAGAIIIVVLFLHYLNKRDERDEKKDERLQKDFDKRDALLLKISDKAFEVHKESNEIIKENTHIIGEVKHALSRVIK